MANGCLVNGELPDLVCYRINLLASLVPFVSLLSSAVKCGKHYKQSCLLSGQLLHWGLQISSNWPGVLNSQLNQVVQKLYELNCKMVCNKNSPKIVQCIICIYFFLAKASSTLWDPRFVELQIFYQKIANRCNDLKILFSSVCLKCPIWSIFIYFLVEEISALFASLVEIGRHFQLKIVIDKKARQIYTNGHFL